MDLKVNEMAPNKMWELQKISFYRILNVTKIANMTKIWRTMAPMLKEKSRAAL